MKLAILGASKPHLPLYLKAKELGLETYCIAWEQGAFCKDYANHFCNISILDKDAVAQLCQEEHIDGIISNALEIAVPTMAYVCEKCGLTGNSYKTALLATNKKEMRLKVYECNASPQPKFHILDHDNFSTSVFPLIIKPTDSSCSNGVTKVSCKDELPKAINRAMKASESREILIEEYIEGREISVESISFHGHHYVLVITDKETTGAPFFVEIAHHQPSNLPSEIQIKVKKYVINILDALEIKNGASHAEFKIDANNNIYFIEIGARGGGDYISYDLVRLSTGYDFVKGMIEVALGHFIEPHISSYKYSGIFFLSKETSYVEDFIEVNKKEPWVVDYQVDKSKPLRFLTKSQDRSGYIIYQSDYKILATSKK